VVIDQDAVSKRKKGASKLHRKSYGHTPLSAEEDIPWNCRRLVIGTAALLVLAFLPGRTRAPSQS